MVKMFLLLSILVLTWSLVCPSRAIAFKGRCANSARQRVKPSQYLQKQKTAGKCLQECLRRADAANATACQFQLWNFNCWLYSEETAYGSDRSERICYVFY